MSQQYKDVVQRHNIAYLVRKQSEPYLRSNKKYDNDQGNILVQIADDIIAGDSEMASLRLDALHYDIKTSLPFQVLDWLDKAELGVDN